MGWQYSKFFKTICRVVLITFYFQTLHVGNLGYRSGDWGLSWHIGYNEAAADDSPQPPTPSQQSLAPGDYLSPTPDANSADPYIIQKVQELSNDPAQIFAFVRDEIGYESYKGSLRGARGTLWSKAGNSLDKASLMIALLRASGVPARYVRGTLADADARKLILSMFPSPLRVVGCINPGTQVSDPANDPKLVAESKEHYWVEYGNNFEKADPNFTEATIGQTFANALNRFNEVPENLRHKVTIRLKRELTSPLSGLFSAGSAQDVATVLNETVNTVDVVGKPVTIGHFVNSSSLGSIITQTTNIYSPYLIFGGDSLDYTQDALIRGQDYQEDLTNFPFASRILTALFLELEVIDADGSVKSYEKTLADRIGITARTNGGSNSLSVNAGNETFVTALDFITLNISASKFDTDLLVNQRDQLAIFNNAIQNKLDDLSQGQSAINVDITNKFTPILQKSLIANSRIRLAQFDARSDFINETISSTSLVKSYFDSPKIIIYQTTVKSEPDNSYTVNFHTDLRKDNIRRIAAPGQNPIAEIGYSTNRGFIETKLESVAISPSEDTSELKFSSVSAQTIWDEVIRQNIKSTFLVPSDISKIDSISIISDAKILITDTLRRGKGVILPSQNVLIEGKSRIAWYEVDLVTGELIGVLDDGSHGAVETTSLYSGLQYENNEFGFLFGFYSAILGGNVLGFAKILLFTSLDKFNDALWDDELIHESLRFKNYFNTLVNYVHQSLLFIASKVSPAYFLGFEAGSLVAFAYTNDPPLDNLLVSPNPLNSLQTPVTLDQIAPDIEPDNLFTLPFNGAQLPTMFRVGIKNNSTINDTFSLDFSNIPTGFTAQTSIPQIAIPPGETVEVGICLKPSSGFPMPGQNASFGINITSISNPGISQTVNEDFVVPDIHGVSLTSEQSSYNTLPGVPVSVNLNIKAVGNVPEIASFSVQVPPVLSASTLNDVALEIGGSGNQTLVLTPDANVLLNSSLTATVTVTFPGASSSSNTQTLQIPVFVAAPGAKAVADAATALENMGNQNLADRLNELSQGLNNLAQNLADDVAKSQSLAALDSIIKQLSADPFLSEFVDEFTAAKLALGAAGTPDDILAALNGLGSSFNAFGTTTTQLRLHNFEASLSPPSIEAQPNVPATIGVRIRNTGSSETTYNLSFESLPADTSGTFNQTSVTLLPGQLSGDITASLTRTAGNELLPSSFNVRVTAEQAPAVSRLIEGNLTVRTEFVSVASVTASPPFVNPKVTPPVLMFISAKILNAVNKARDALVSFKVKDSNGQEVFASSPVNTALSVQTALTDVDLGAFNPQGLPEGTYTAEVSVTDTDGTPIPGGSGTGNLLLGSPVTAGLSNDPDKLPPGTSTVTHTLKINSQLILPPLSVVGQAQIPDSNLRSGVAVKDNIAYACSANGIQLFDVADPALPHWLKTVGSGVNIGCKIQGDLLLTLGLPSGNAGASILQVYSLKNDPLNPAPLGSSPPINYNLQTDLASNQTSAFVAQFSFCNFLHNNDVFAQTGDLLSIPLNVNDLIAPAAASPALADVLFNTHGDNTFDPNDVSGCAVSGGDGNVWQLAVADENTLLVATTTIKGTDTQAGIGRVLVIDTTDPANLSIVKEVQISGTAHVIGIAVDGDRALIVSSTGGWRDFFSNTDPNNDVLLTGNLVFSTLLLTDPRNPILLGSQSISRQSRTFWNGGLTSLGNGRFAYFSLGGVNDAKQILMIDANDPFNLVFGQTNVPAENIGPNAITAKGELIYTTDAAGNLIIYKLPELPVVPVKASVKVPKNTGVTVDPGSFTEAPSEIIQGNDFDTLVWERNLTAGSSLLLNWQTTIDNLQPGEARQTTQGGTVDFTFENTTGQVPLSPTTVVSEQLLTLAPATQTVRSGATALYNLTVKNPAASPVSYELSIQGIPPSWAQLDSPLLLEANEERTIALPIAVGPFTAAGLRSLVITAQGDNGARGAVQGELVIEDDPVIPAADSNAHGVIMALTPSNATAGHGTSARYTVRVINTGSSTETFRLDTTFLPANFVSAFDSPVITVPPGASNFRDVGLTVTPPADTLPTDYPFSVQAVFDANNEVGTTSQGLLTVVNAGVSLAFNQVSGNPGETLSLNITNTGTIEDDFMLSLLGPGGFISSLSDPSVHLLPGAFTTVGVTLGDAGFALPGNLSLFARATSVYDSAVQALSKANIVVAERKGLSATLDPAVAELTAPGAKNFLIKVKNTGNIEDAYSATITQVAGPVSASLAGLDGNPAQSIPVFRLPALADGSLNLGLSLNTTGIGTVKVLISSNTEPSIQQELTAQLGLAESNQAPNADAGQNKNVFTGVPLALDGSASADPDGDLISYQWRFVSVPAGSVLGDDSIVNNQTSAPLITPDVAGVYRLELIVSDGLLNSSPAYVELTAAKANVPPNAIAGQDQTVLAGEPVTLDGSLSHDQDNGPAPLSFNWSFITVPARSGLDNDLISPDSQNPAKASFTPDVKGAYELRLRVSDGEAFDDDILTVTATLANVPPVANAGVDLIIQSGDVVNLNAELSSDSDQSPSPLSFSWRFVSLPVNSGLTNSAIVSDSQNPAKASFTPDQAGDYVLAADVSDGEAVSTDNILVKVLPALRYQDISDLFRITPSNEKTVLNRQTRKLTSSVTLTLTNISALDIKTPIRVLFELTSSAVSIPGAAFDQNSGKLYLDLPGNVIQPGGTEVLNVQFVYPAGTQFRYDTRAFGKVGR